MSTMTPAMALSFFASVIKSGEPWTATCQQALDEARAHLAQPAQAVDVGAILELACQFKNDEFRVDEFQEKLTLALSGEKAGLVDDEVLVAIERGEGYEDVHPELVAEDCMGNAAERGWRWRVVSASPAPDKEGFV